MGRRMGMMDECAFIGDATLSGKHLEANRWEIEEQVKSEFSTLLPEETLDKLLARIKGREDIFAEMAQTGSAILQVYIRSDGYPGFMLSPRQLAIIARLGVTVDLDFYCDREEQI